ncbi:MAG: hypothetical protein Tsb0034_08780 [Ekhidna sp.]
MRFFSKILLKFKQLKRVFLIRVNSQNIRLGKNISVYKNAKIQVRHGGSIEIGDNTEILDGVLILTYGGNIKIGSRCSINPYSIIYGHGGTIIGDDVLIAGHCMIIPNNHNFDKKGININQQGMTSKGIVIEKNVWIGHGCTILDGVTIGSGSVIAAGSVVKEDVSASCLVAGVPAKVIKEI